MALEKLGPYKLNGILGRGGMGTVYRAKHDEADDECAVKALAPMFACDEHFRSRFESEIKALIQLDHPNIVRLIGYGQDEGNLFFAMELVEGNSLFQMQRQGHRFGWIEILGIAKDIGKGLRHAHDRGIIHRDLKPGNVLRSTDGINKITDFGIAKSFGGSQITGDNVLGTMDFMSPEQAKGKPVTARSDLYSLGTMLFTLLSGKPPFKANSVEESLRNLTRVPPPMVSSVAPDVPHEIDWLIRKLMDKDPEKRIPTAMALLKKIDEIQDQLKGHSEAKTSQQKADPGIKSDETFETNITGRSSDRTMRKTGGKSKNSIDRLGHTREETEGNTADKNKSDGKQITGSGKKNVYVTTVDTEADSDVHSRYVDPTQQKDFFETVTEQQRDRLPVDEDAPKSRGLIPVMLALLAVSLLGGYGLYRAYAVPSADDLYAAITETDATPDRLREQIGQFLENYPEDERIEDVEMMDRIAGAMAIHKNITVRNNMTGVDRVSDTEKQFFDIIEMSKSDPPAAYSRLSAFLTLHENQEMSPNDSKCVTAARGYLEKIARDADDQVDANREKIESAFSRAAEATPAEATKIYNSVIELYGSRPWAEDLVRKARQQLESLPAVNTPRS